MKRFNQKLKFNIFLLLGAVVFLSSCGTEQVPVGYVGMITTTNGLQEEVHQPGNISCYGRDKLYLLETSEEKHTTKMNILCKDDLNFAFNVNVRTKLNYSNKEDVKEILQSKGGSAKKQGESNIWRLDYDVIYNTYVSSVVDASSRSIVSKYETTQIRENRDKIRKAIFTNIKKELKGTPVDLLSVNLTNFDYPDVITKSLEDAKKRQIEREQEQHIQELKLMRLDNEKIAAVKQKEVNKLLGEAEAEYIKQISSALDGEYLTLKDIEAKNKLYGRVGKGDKVIMNSNISPFVNVK